MEFVHLDGSAIECLCYDNLIVGVLLSCLSAEAEVRRLSVNGMETVLADILLGINENPAFSVLSSIAVAFEVSAVDVPCAPVTILICTSVVTSSQSVEEGINGIECTEDDVGVAIGIGHTTPLGSLDFLLFASLFVNFCCIEGNTVDEIAIEAVAPFAYGVTIEQDVETFLVSCYDSLQVLCLCLDAIIVERKVLHDVSIGSTHVLRAGSDVLCGIAFVPCTEVFSIDVEDFQL